MCLNMENVKKWESNPWQAWKMGIEPMNIAPEWELNPRKLFKKWEIESLHLFTTGNRTHEYVLGMWIETIQLFEYGNRFHEPIQVCNRNFTNLRMRDSNSWICSKGCIESIQMFENGNRTHDMFEEWKVKSIFMVKIVKWH